MLRIGLVLALAVPLAGCAEFKTKTSAAVADVWPQFLGGLPPDAPPRPGDPRYPKFVAAEKHKLAEAKSSKASDQKQPAATKETKQP